MVLENIREYIAEHGYPPTLREIGARMGIRSTNGVTDHLRALERKGFVRTGENTARGIQILDRAGETTDLPELKASVYERLLLKRESLLAELADVEKAIRIVKSGPARGIEVGT
jgi:SOS-response transcriptional repressor LexA